MRRISLLLVAAMFAVNMNAQVNLSTGTAEYSLPIFSYSDSKSGLSSSVSINYSSGGIRAGEQASNLGLGWYLNAGGSIDRMQNGEPDDQYNPNNFGLANDVLIVKRDVWAACDNYYPNGFLYSTIPVTDNPKQLAIMPRFTSSQTKDFKQSPLSLNDREQDVFMCNMNGRAVGFVIGRDQSIHCLDGSKLKISFTTKDMTGDKVRTKINSFSVVDESGVKYVFAEMELGEVVDLMEVMSDDDGLGLNVQRSKRTGSYVVNKWFLTQVLNPMTNESIKFAYKTVGLDVATNVSATYSRVIDEDGESVSVIEGHAYTRSKRVSKIEFPDGHYLDFFYDPTIRLDVPGDIPLTSIGLKRKGQLVKQFSFVQEYFYKKQRVTDAHQPTYDKRFLRLCLAEVKVTGSNGIMLPPYKFDYYTGAGSSDPLDIVPSRMTFNVDHWGYYNKGTITDDNATAYDKNSLKDLLTNPASYRAAYPSAASFGMLRTVHLPGGGTMTYEYEQNSYLKTDNVTEAFTGGVRVRKITVHDAVSTANDMVTEYRYELASGHSSGWGADDEPAYYAEKPVDMRKDLSGYKYGGLILYDHTSMTRIKTLSKIHGFLASVAIAIVGSSAGPTPVNSSLQSAVVFIDNLTYTFRLKYITTWLDQWDYATIATHSLYAPNLVNAQPFQYSRVEAKVTSISNGGKTIIEFTKPSSSTEILANDFPYSQKQRSEAWKYGLPLKTYVYNSTNNLVAYSENTYDIQTTTLDDNFKSCAAAPNHYLSNRYDWTSFNNSHVDDSWISREFYNMKTGRVRLLSTLEKKYDVTGAQFATSTVHYGYNDANNQLSSTYTENSKGEVKGSNVYYPVDYNSGTNTALDYMVQHNMIGVPVTQVEWMVPAGGGSRNLLSASATEFKQLPDGRVRPYILYTSVLPAPLVHSLANNVDPANVYSYSFYEHTAGYEYNLWGDLIAMRDTRGRVNSKIWGYANRRVIADVIGAEPTEIVHTSFEKDTYTPAVPELDNPDNLDIGQSARMYYNKNNIVSDFAVTGEYIYPASENVSFPMRFAKPSVLTVWATGNKIELSGNPPDRTGPTIKGWTYYEFDIAEGSQDLLLTEERGSGIYIDELRIYPKGAKMTTFTYNPSIGKTDECDANNRITYFEYDGLGRLYKVKDEKRNIIKTYEYHYKNN